MKSFTLALFLLALAPSAHAAPASSTAPDAALGTWQVYNDHGDPDGRVRLFLHDGKLVGVVAALRPDTPPGVTCTACDGAQKNQPILGLVVLWGFDRDDDGWSDGTILEPSSGKTYHSTVKVTGRDTLEVRGYVGLSIFGRSQTWRRAPN